MKFQVMNAKIGDQSVLTNNNYIFEPKLDGIRALCYVNKELKFFSRNNIDITSDYPEFDFRDTIKAQACVLDGEIIVYDKQGIPSFSAWQSGGPAYYIVFDILMLNGKSLVTLPLVERKKILKKIVTDTKNLEKIVFTTDGKKLFNLSKKMHLEGVVAKEKDGIYYPGQRKATWLKVKFLNTLDCIIVGYTTKKRTISSLALALYYYKGQLQYIGNVGTGFNEQLLDELAQLFRKYTVKMQPDLINFNNPRIKTISWLRPQLVCEVKFREFTKDQQLRQSVFLRLRPDKKAKDCTFKDQI